MSYNQRVLNDLPRHFYPLTTGSFIDATGRANGESLGTPVEAPPLVVGGGNSMVFTGNDNFKFSTDIFQTDSVRHPFSLEAWFKPVSITGVKGIVGHLNQEDGLTFDGEKISFTTLHGTAGPATASWFPPVTSAAMNVIGVHTGERNELYVNGVRVASVTLEEEQILSSYQVDSAPGFLYAGHGPGTVIVDSVAVYAHALTSRQAKLHFLWGRDAPDFRSVIDLRGGTYWDFTDQSAGVAFDFAFSTSSEWSRGQGAQVRTENDMLTPVIENELTADGVWMNGFILSAVAEAVDGSKIWWDGDGSFVVETSLNDGTTWTVAENGQEVSGIGKGFVTGNQSLQVRITLPAGEPEDTITKVRSLNIRLYSERLSYPSVSERPAEFFGKVALAQQTHQPIEHDDFMGASLYNGYAKISGGDAYRTVEAWIKLSREIVDTDRLFDFRDSSDDANAWVNIGTGHKPIATGGTAYVNGVPASTHPALVPGRWYLVSTVLDEDNDQGMTVGSNYTGSLTSNSNISVGFLSTYPVASTQAQIVERYNAYMGIPSVQVTEPTAFDVTDAATSPVKLYAYSWSTVGSG